MPIAMGTLILTARGEVPVEALREGHAVETVRGDFLPVVFLGYRLVNCRRHPRPMDVWPVRIRADAIADSVPARDLLLSPDHAVLIGDVLIEAGLLVNGMTIIQEPADEIGYRHVELSRHDILFAEGLACDSCPDEHGDAPFENIGKVMQLHPRFSARASAEAGFSRVSSADEEFAVIQHYLAERGRAQASVMQPGTVRGGTVPR
jgi:hypothetical protein